MHLIKEHEKGSNLDGGSPPPLPVANVNSTGMKNLQMRASGRLASALKLKTLDRLQKRIPELSGIEIDTDIQSQSTSPFAMMNATLWLREFRHDDPAGKINESAKIEFMVVKDLLSAFFTITDPNIRDAGLSAVFFEKILLLAPEIKKGSFCLTGMNSISFMLAITSQELKPDEFKKQVEIIYGDKSLQTKLHSEFCKIIRAVNSPEKKEFEEILSKACFERTPLGRMLKGFGFSHLYEADIDLTFHTPDVIIRISRPSEDSDNFKLTLNR